MSALTREAVLEALAKVEDPAFNKPMLELGTLLDVVVEGDSVRASVRLSAPSDELQVQHSRAHPRGARAARRRAR